MTDGTPDERLPALERGLIRFGSWFSPAKYRDRWIREWTAEAWFARRSGRPRMRVLWRTAWSWVDAMALWRREVSVEGWRGDLRMSLRSAMRSPKLSGVVVLTLAVGIGVGSAIFSVVDTVLWQDLDLPEPERLVRFSQERPANAQVGWGYSWAMYRTLTDGVTTAELAGYSSTWFDVETENGPVRVSAARVTDTFFPLTGISLELGRAFTREEEASGQNLVVVSHDFWRNALGEDPDVLGRPLPLGGVSFEVIGVAAASDRLLRELNRASGFASTPNLYLPLEPFGSMQAELTSTIQLLGRLRPGVEVEQAREDVFRIQDAFLNERGATNWETHAIGVKDYIVKNSRTALLILFGSVGVLLAMVCANLGGLILVRGTARAHEWAARRALGASGLRIGRQLVAEGAFLALLGAASGFALANVLIRLVGRNAPSALPRSAELAVDGKAFLFSLLLAVCATLVFALLPAITSVRTAPSRVLTASRQTAGRGTRRTLSSLVAFQVSLSVVLLAGSGVLLRSLANLLAQDPGYDTTEVLQAIVDLPLDSYPADVDVARYARDVSDRLAGLPGVDAVAVGSTTIPISGPRIGFQIEGRPGEDGQGGAMQVGVSPGYFDVMRISMKDGRAFTAADEVGEGVAVITAALAARYWPDGNAVGQRVSIGSWRTFRTAGTSTPPVVREIVGVTEDLSASGIDTGPPVEMLFAPMQQDPWRTQSFLIRTSGDPAELAEATRSAVTELDPARAVYDVRPLLEYQRQAIDRERIVTIVVVGFGLSALLLSGLGIYGVVAYSVTLRRREIGVRVALGAEAGSVSRLFAVEALAPVVSGAMIGFLVAGGTVRLLAGLLYEVDPLDPMAFIGAGALLAGAALTSAYVPARQTAAVDPVEAMRA